MGDSVGLTLGWGLEKEQGSLGLLTWNAAGMGCGFIDTEERLENDGQWTNAMPGRCRAWRQAWPSDVASFHPDVALMLFGPWDALDAKVGDQLLEVGTPEWQAYAYGQLEYAVDAISSAGRESHSADRPLLQASRHGPRADRSAAATSTAGPSSPSTTSTATSRCCIRKCR